MIDKEQLNNWKINIFNSIKNISDLETQKISWLGNHPIYQSSFSEIINTLYDDSEFEEYISYLKKNGTNRSLYSKMVLFEKKLSNYIKTDKTDIEVLNDSEWKELTLQAKEIIKLWITY